MYNRDEDVWDELTTAALAYLRRVARAGGASTYSQLNDELVLVTGSGFDFSQQSERAAMGYLLSLVVDRDFDPQAKLIISCLVHYMGRTDPGPGFFTLAVTHGLLDAGASATAKMTFWIGQVNAVHAAAARGWLLGRTHRGAGAAGRVGPVSRTGGPSGA